MYRAITKPITAIRKIKPHNAGNTDLLAVINGRSWRHCRQMPVALPSVREAHIAMITHPAAALPAAAKPMTKAKPVTIIGVGNRHTNSEHDRPV